MDDGDLANRSPRSRAGLEGGAHCSFPGTRCWVKRSPSTEPASRSSAAWAPWPAAIKDFDDQKIYIPLTTMQELFAMKGENIPQDALTSMQYQPAIKGDDVDAAVPAVHRVIAHNHGFDPSLKDAFDEWDTIHTSASGG